MITKKLTTLHKLFPTGFFHLMQFPEIEKYGGAAFFDNYFSYHHSGITVYDDSLTVLELATTTLNMNKWKYDKLYNTLNLDYQIDVDMMLNETTHYSGSDTDTTQGGETVSRSGTDKVNSQSSTTTTTNAEVGKTTYDTDDFKNTEKNSGTDTGTGSGETSTTYGRIDTTEKDSTLTRKYGKTEEKTKTGRNEPVQSLIQREREIALFSLQSVIINDILDSISIPIYLHHIEEE